MPSKKYEAAVYIGRFQPFHLGHLAVVQRGLELADDLVILVGSSNLTTSSKNPFTYSQRVEMITTALHNVGITNFSIRPLKDDPDENAWISSVQLQLIDLRKKKVALIGHFKDSSSYYLKSFPTLALEEVPHFHNSLSATDIRAAWYDNFHSWYQNLVPHSVFTMMAKLAHSTCDNTYHSAKDEYDFVKQYKRKWESAPYKPTFVTVDAVYVHSGHVLLIERKGQPGKGKWALPGGFISPTESLEDSMIRELREETKVKMPEPILRGNIKAVKVFDNPNRSLRGRTITHAFFINILTGELPKVQGSDDAAKAFWLPLASLDSRDFYEDHFFIIKHFTGI